MQISTVNYIPEYACELLKSRKREREANGVEEFEEIENKRTKTNIEEKASFINRDRKSNKNQDTGCNSHISDDMDKYTDIGCSYGSGYIHPALTEQVIKLQAYGYDNDGCINNYDNNSSNNNDYNKDSDKNGGNTIHIDDKNCGSDNYENNKTASKVYNIASVVDNEMVEVSLHLSEPIISVEECAMVILYAEDYAAGVVSDNTNSSDGRNTSSHCSCSSDPITPLISIRSHTNTTTLASANDYTNINNKNNDTNNSYDKSPATTAPLTTATSTTGTANPDLNPNPALDLDPTSKDLLSTGWTTSRHYAVPTTDLPIHSIPPFLNW